MFTRLRVALIRKLVRRQLGKDIAPLETAATHPDHFLAYASFNRALETANLVSAKLKAMAQIRVAKIVECPF